MTEDPQLTVTALVLAETHLGNQALLAAGVFGVSGSDDAGATWQRICLERRVPAVTDLAVSQGFARNGRIYVGTADGVLVCSRSSGSCRHALAGAHVFALAVTPTGGDEHTADATGAEEVFVGTERDGLLCSRDGGPRWEARNAGLLDLSILAFAASPAFMSDRTAFVGTATGIQRSRNGGRAWRSLDLAVTDDAAVQCIALSPRFVQDQRVFAGTEDSGLFVSHDAGDSWEPVRSLREPTINVIGISPKSGTMAVGTHTGVYLSDDVGVTWREGQVAGVAVLTLCWLKAEDGEWLLTGLHERGVARSSDRGKTWTVVDPTGGS